MKKAFANISPVPPRPQVDAIGIINEREEAL